MKNIRKYILFLCAACMGLMSCVKEDMAGGFDKGYDIFTARYESPVSKTVLSGLTPAWEPKDSICVYDGGNLKFVNTNLTVSSEAKFAGKIVNTDCSYYVAVSPYREDLYFSPISPMVYGVMLPTVQTAVRDSYDPAAAAAIAYTTSNVLSFKNLVSLVKFEVISDGVESVTLYTNADEHIAGKYNAKYEAQPKVFITEGASSIELKGNFEKNSVYYIATLPASLERGITVLLNGNIKTFVLDAPINLARSGVVDLGTFSLNPSESQKPTVPDEGEDDAVASAWGLLGEHNGWNENAPTPMYEIGSNFVAFDVPAAAAGGFKFKNGETWIGTTATVTLDTWVTAQGEGGENIVFTAAADALYDIYMAASQKAFYITLAGSPAPAPMPKPFAGMAVAGTFNSWSTSANPVVEEGEYYVLKGVKAAMANSNDAGDKGFKFVYTGEDESVTWYGVSSPSISASKWYNVASGDGAANVYVSGDASADYDIYLTKDRAKFCVVPAGGQVPSADEEGGSDPGNSGDVETLGTIYLKPNSNWLEAGARYSAYFFEGESNVWISMISDVESGVYQCGIPVGYTNVIFVRMNPNVSDNRWNNDQDTDQTKPVWNQTGDQKVPVDGNVCFVMTSGSWDSGQWMSYPPTVMEPDPGQGNDGQEVCRLTVRVNKAITWFDKYIYSWNESGELSGYFGGTKLLFDKEDGDYYVYYHNFAKSLDGALINYIISGDGAQTKDLSVTLNGANTTVTVEASDLK